ncbi:MAG: hypothetical protein MRECE_33c011 [Mycoplasmataceae bacterium CE_OT135]|nr:MAG: hypothetical protein MRECE_33c011 [Mycoplasmataceae bacterium CE_OT135]
MGQRINYLIRLWKQDRSRFWQELKLWFCSWFRWPFRLTNPIRCRTTKMVRRSLIGHSFHFFHPRSYKVRSPLTGYIAKIYVDDTTLHLVGDNGLQVILTIKFRAQFTSIYEAVRCLVKEKQKVKQGSVLFLIIHEKQVASVAVMIPWQPWLLKKVNKLPPLGKYFASLYYRNPWDKKAKIKRFGQYQ